MQDKKKAAVIGSLLADSFALAPHWIYDTQKIKNEFGRIESLLQPLEGSYHEKKDKGEFTHYGDQVFVLLQSMATQNGFDLQDFSKRWRELFTDYEGYYDHATKDTLKNYEAGKSPAEAGSQSTEYSGAARIAPLFYWHVDDPDHLFSATQAQTKMTHGSQQVLDTATFLTRVTLAIFDGHTPREGIAAAASERYKVKDIANWVDDGLNSIGEDSTAAIKSFGQSCSTNAAFPGVIHLLAKYHDNYAEAMTANVMAGGDSAARGLAVGMILGAHLGMDAIPDAWLADFKKLNDIQSLLT